MPEKLDQKIQAVLDAKMKPLLRAHNMDIELITIDKRGVVRLRLLGACASCIAAEQTVDDFIVEEVRESCPWVTAVRVEMGVSEELVQQAIEFLRKPRR